MTATTKKLPAHEVILAELDKYCRRMTEVFKYGISSELAELETLCPRITTLCEVLGLMIVPETSHAEILRCLQEINAILPGETNHSRVVIAKHAVASLVVAFSDSESAAT